MKTLSKAMKLDVRYFRGISARNIVWLELALGNDSAVCAPFAAKEGSKAGRNYIQIMVGSDNEAGDKSAEQKALDIEYHRHAASGYDDAVTRSFHFYHVHSLHRWARELVRQRPGAFVLDMGTGTGVVACTLASFGCKVKAVDHSMDMLARGTARAKAAGVAQSVQFELADCESLKYPDGLFDAVAIQGVLHHLPDVMPILKQAVRVLKPGGHLYVSEPCAESTPLAQLAHLAMRPLRKLRNLLSGAKPQPSVSDHEKPISGPALVEAIQSLGIETQQEYLVQFGAVRFLPERMRIWAILLLSAPTRRTRGNLVFVSGRKTALVTRPAVKPVTATPAKAASRATGEVPAKVTQSNRA